MKEKDLIEKMNRNINKCDNLVDRTNKGIEKCDKVKIPVTFKDKVIADEVNVEKPKKPYDKPITLSFDIKPESFEAVPVNKLFNNVFNDKNYEYSTTLKFEDDEETEELNEHYALSFGNEGSDDTYEFPTEEEIVSFKIDNNEVKFRVVPNREKFYIDVLSYGSYINVPLYLLAYNENGEITRKLLLGTNFRVTRSYFYYNSDNELIMKFKLLKNEA